MNAKLKVTLAGFLAVVFAMVGSTFFLHQAPSLGLFSLLIPLVIGIQLLAGVSFGSLLAVVTTVLGIFCMGRWGHASVPVIGPLLLLLWLCVLFLFMHLNRLRGRDFQFVRERENLLIKQQILQKEIEFYEHENSGLARRALQRRQLSEAARVIGALLDPSEIQRELIQTARFLFPGRHVEITRGSPRDSFDTFVLQKRQPLQVPNEMFSGEPLLAVPISLQRAVVGILRVGGSDADNHDKTPFSREDLRLLDVLASIASLAMENGLLFKQVEQTAMRDNLTGFLTHRAFREHLDEAILSASRYNQPLSIISIDIDHFKLVNDTHGHQAGDAILQGFAHVLDRNLRDVDIPARVGGEEFVVILLQTNHSEAMQTAERTRRDLAEQGFDIGGGQSLTVTSSFGVATFPDDATSVQQLLRQADQRLYKAKTNGRNRVEGRNS